MTQILGINHDEVVSPGAEMCWELVPLDFHKPYRDLLARIEDIVRSADSSRAVLVHPLEEYYLCAVFPEKGTRLIGRIRLLQALYRACDEDGL